MDPCHLGYGKKKNGNENESIPNEYIMDLEIGNWKFGIGTETAGINFLPDLIPHAHALIPFMRKLLLHYTND